MKTLANIFCIVLFFSLVSAGQAPAKLNSVDIYHKIEKLNFLGSALYLAAHPDDENTKLISYLSNQVHASTGYLSLTRGDGGQNLIGTEIWEKLGVIRTQELLGARRIDGGQQFFSRANDFGYSKHPDETFRIWNKDEVLKDVVKVIREFRPDIIINRFDHRTPGTTHGHHTGSAILSMEGTDLAADVNWIYDKDTSLSPWQVKRVFYNTSWWFYGSRENFEAADKSHLFGVDVGVYFPGFGKSNAEIAALSRTMHKSQGFGSTGSRGKEMEYLELVKGEMDAGSTDLFEGINTTWSRIDGGEQIEENLNSILEQFNFNSPEESLPKLLDLYKSISEISDDFWRNKKLSELKDIIRAASGLFVEAVASEPYSNPGNEISISIESINRSNIEMSISKIQIEDQEIEYENGSLLNNEGNKIDLKYKFSYDHDLTNPYWLNEKGTNGMYKVSYYKLIGRPESDPTLSINIIVSIGGIEMPITLPVIYKKNDPVNGEMYQPFALVPKASLAFTNPVYIFADRNEKEVSIRIKNYSDSLKGVLTLQHPSSWIVKPASLPVELKGQGAEQLYTFKIKGPLLQESAVISAELLTDDNFILNKDVITIDFDHIPLQYIVGNTDTKVERISLSIKGRKIAYIDGAGDEVPQSLKEIGYEVDIINPDKMSLETLEPYDALIFGIRAFNTKPELLLKKDVIQAYMENGGTVVMQYNTTSRDFSGDDIAPYPMTMSRDRVTDENAVMSFVDAEHEVLNYPNKITSRDFENWVQERGLYFPKSWDSRYSTPLATSDFGEPLSKGGLLIAKVGKGHFIYTGLSWFRELPAGVPGAFRLFANIISIGKNGLDTGVSGAKSTNER